MMADDYVPLEFEEEVVETADVMDLDIDVPDTEINNDTDRCIICKESSSETLSNISQGLNTIRENCDITGRRDILDYLQLMPHDTKHKIHASCRRRIAYEASKVERDKTAALSACKKRQTRSMTGGFVFHKQCFLCGEPCLDSKDMRKVLSGGEFDSSIRDMIQNVRGYDAWALEVQGRLEFVNDLFAVDAIYHSVCLSRFRTNLLHTPHKVKRGRPQNADALHAFERLCERLEAECENELFTLSDLHKMMCELSGDGCEVYGREYFKELLQKRYGSHIYFASRPGRNDVVGFANYCDLLLHDKFFSDLVEGEGSEAEKLVKKAASLILGDIREMECRRDCYPNASDIKSDGLQFLPPLLKTFMTRLINCPLKQASIGQAIVHAARPRGGVMLPLLFGVAVDVAQCGLNDMQIKLSRLGFSFSVDEIRRYKHSIMNMSCDSSTASDQIPTMHFVADNVDHNVRTLDGLGTFHGMGIISVTSAQGGALVNTHRVSRLEKPIKLIKRTIETPVKQCITVLDKKVRNLEKRKSKLDSYRDKAKEGKALDKDQQEAVAKYEVVIQNLDFARELQKQFQQISNDTDKGLRKQAKREKLERQQQEALRLQDVFKLQSILDSLGSDTMREELKSGKWPSLTITDEHLKQLDDFYQLIAASRDSDIKFSDQLISAADHMTSYLDQLDKEVVGTTYKNLYQLIDKINTCGYFEQGDVATEPEQTISEVVHASTSSEISPQKPVEATPEPEDYEDEEEEEEVTDNGVAATKELGHAPSSDPDSYQSSQADVQSTHWSHQSIAQDATMAPATSHPANRNLATGMNAQQLTGGYPDGAYPNAAANYLANNAAYASRPRPLQEIVSSMQGNYNFLQESQIELENPTLVATVMPVAGQTQGSQQLQEGVYATYDNQNSVAGFTMPQHASHSLETSVHHASPHHFMEHVSAAQQQPGQIYHQPGLPSAFGVQGLHHNVYGHQMQPSHDSGYPVDSSFGQMSTVADSTHVNSVVAGPQPIPLPSQTLHGPSIVEQTYSSAQPQHTDTNLVDVKNQKSYTMNPNAISFQYKDDALGSQSNKSDAQSAVAGAGDAGPAATRTFAQTASANFQGGSSYPGGFGGAPPQRNAGGNRGGRGGGPGTPREPVNNGMQPLPQRSSSKSGFAPTPNAGSNGSRGGGRSGPGGPASRGGGAPRGTNGGIRGGSSSSRGGFSRHEQQASA